MKKKRLRRPAGKVVGEAQIMKIVLSWMKSGKMETLLQKYAGDQAPAKSAASRRPDAKNNPNSEMKMDPDENGWVKRTVRNKPKKEEESAVPTEQDESKYQDVLLASNGFNVQIVADCKKLSLRSSGVALASRAFAKEALKEYAAATTPLAVLIKGTLPDVPSTKVEVAVKDTNGKVHIREKQLIQLGVGQNRVTMANQQAQPIQADTEVISVVVHKAWVSGELWASLLKKPMEGARRWLKDMAKVTPIDVRKGTRTSQTCCEWRQGWQSQSSSNSDSSVAQMAFQSGTTRATTGWSGCPQARRWKVRIAANATWSTTRGLCAGPRGSV